MSEFAGHHVIFTENYVFQFIWVAGNKKTSFPLYVLYMYKLWKQNTIICTYTFVWQAESSKSYAFSWQNRRDSHSLLTK